MSRCRQLFRETDLAKALRAAKREGVAVRIEITPDKMVVISGRPEQDAGTADPDLDRELAAFEASHGAD